MNQLIISISIFLVGASGIEPLTLTTSKHALPLSYAPATYLFTTIQLDIFL